ncbi:MAG: MarR family transcriptional regulator [Lachnospiraceae bacterium]|nr:MarR family transcriptional regulator [Lachnospiraceae bacterium]MDY3818419.1 MarR family transcriptional regulator [Lachnospiraceae bacterium]
MSVSLEKSFATIYTKFKLHFYQTISKRKTVDASLTIFEVFCMEGILALEEPTIAQFGRLMNLSTPNAAYKVNNLVKKGYVERVQSQTDKREYHLKPTQKYLDEYNVSYSYLDTVIARAREHFSEEELEKFAQMLEFIGNELMPEGDVE